MAGRTAKKREDLEGPGRCKRYAGRSREGPCSAACVCCTYSREGGRLYGKRYSAASGPAVQSVQKASILKRNPQSFGKVFGK